MLTRVFIAYCALLPNELDHENGQLTATLPVFLTGNNQGNVTVAWSFPGAGPTEVQEQITLPLEQAISTLNGVTNLSSTSRENISQIIVQFTLESDPKDAFNNVRERVATVQRSLPTGAITPVGINQLLALPSVQTMFVTRALCGAPMPAAIRCGTVCPAGAL